MRAYQTIMKYFETVPVPHRRIWLMGDILDMEFLVSKSESFKLAKKFKDFDGYFVPKVEAEYQWFEFFYEDLCKYVLPHHITFFEGNHEQRLRRDNFKKFLPIAYAHMFDLAKQLKFEQRGINYIEYNDWLRVTTNSGTLMATHGIYCGANPIKKHVDVAKTSVIFGHTHERGVVSFKCVEGTFMGFNNPCLCNTDAVYMEGRPHNWSVGASMLTFDDDYFWMNQLTINNGSLRDPQGRLYK